MLENEKKEKNVTVDKIKSLFKKIKNFNQLKEEVCDIKNLCQANSDDINKIKEKYSKLNNRKDSFPGPGSYKIPSSFNYISNMTREKGAYNPRFKYI